MAYLLLVERGKLDEAEEKYQQCISANPNDSKAKAELDYVREQKAKRKSRLRRLAAAKESNDAQSLKFLKFVATPKSRLRTN